MSHVNVFFAIEAPYGAFFKPTGGNVTQCPLVPAGHRVRAGANFCDHCGTKTVERPIEEPTEAFKAFCDAREVEPRFAYHQLVEDGWEWSDDAPVASKTTIGLYRVQTVDEADRRDPRQHITALGIKLKPICEDDPLSAMSFTAEDLAKYEAPVREIAAAFNITGTPRLYIQLYVSY